MPNKFLGYIVYASALLTFVGMIKNPSILEPSWALDGSLSRLGYYSLFFLLCTVIISYKNSDTLFKTLCVACVVFPIIAIGTSSAMIPLLFLFSSRLLGGHCVNLLKITSLNLRFFQHTVLGASLYTFFLYALSHTNYNNQQVYSLLLLIPLLIRPAEVFKAILQIKDEISILPSFSKGEKTLSILLLFILGIHLHQNIRPEFSYDALVAHLMIPHFISVNGFWSFSFDQFIFGVNQLGADLMLSLSYVLGGEPSARFLNFLFLCLSFKFLFDISRIWASRINSLLVIVALAASPVMFTQSSTLHIEAIWLTFLLGATHLTLLVLRLDKERFGDISKLLYCIAIVSGAALATKMPSLFYLPFLAIIILYKLITVAPQRSYILKPIGIALGVFLIVGGVQYVYCYYVTGNPVFPYFNGIFQSPYFYQSSSFNNPIFNRPLNFRTIYDMTFHGAWYLESKDHPISLIYLIFTAPLFAFSLSQRKSLPTLLISSQVFLAFCGIFMFQSYFRYLLPSFALLIPLLAKFLEHLKLKGRRLYLFSIGCILLAIPFSIIHIPDPTHHYLIFNWTHALSKKVPNDYKYQRPQKIIFDYLNSRYGRIASVAHLESPLTAGLDANSLVNAWYNPEFADRISKTNTQKELEQLIEEYGITHFIGNLQTFPNKVLANLILNISSLEFRNRAIHLHKVDFRKLPSVSLLNDERAISGVSFRVPLLPSRKYALITELRSANSNRSVWQSVIDWKDNAGTSISQEYEIEAVEAEDQVFEYYVEAPKNAVEAIVSPPLSVENQVLVSSTTFVMIGDSSATPHYDGP